MHEALLIAALLLPQAPGASEDIDSRWYPWLGCWTLVEDERREPFFPEPAESETTPASRRARVCLTPSEQSSGAEITTFSDGEVFLREEVVGDGVERPRTEGECRGWQRVTWSADGHRLFTRSELTCEENRRRIVSGLSIMTAPSTWVEVQSVGNGDARAVVVRRYRRARDPESESARATVPREVERRGLGPVTARMNIDDVIEATARVEPEVVEAALLEYDSSFALDADALVRLDEAEVDSSIIDLMVALSFPEQFQIEEAPAEESGGPLFFGSPTLYAPYYTSSFRYPYYLAPFGYYYWYAPYDPRFVVRPIVTRDTSVVGRVVEGRGYTRISRRAPASTGRFAKPRGSDGSSSRGGSSVQGGSSSGSVTKQGYTRSGSTGRRAKPKKKN